MKILIIEDENSLRNNMIDYLSSQDYICEWADNLNDAIDKIVTFQYDCILLDLMLPDGNGLTIMEYLRQEKKTDGVIIISAKNSLDDKIKGLHLGADDYLAKPFHLSELAARIFSVIRRKQFNNTNKLQWEEIVIDLPAREVSINYQLVHLTKKEFDLLLFFVGNKNKVISKGALAEHLSGDMADMFDNHDFVYAHVKNLKKKLQEAGCGNYLQTVYGVGYKWAL